jgi:hypothetical protein
MSTMATSICRECRGAVRRFGHDAKVVKFLQPRLPARPHDRMVVDDKQSNVWRVFNLHVTCAFFPEGGPAKRREFARKSPMTQQEITAPVRGNCRQHRGIRSNPATVCRLSKASVASRARTWPL